MTREEQNIIDDMRNIVKPIIAKMLLETNFEGCGKEDKAEFETEFEKILTLAEKALEQELRWILVSERLPTKEEYIANNGLFIVTDGNRTYAEYFDVYNSMKYFGEPTMNGFRVDRCVSAWMPLPKPYREVEE